MFVTQQQSLMTVLPLAPCLLLVALARQPPPSRLARFNAALDAKADSALEPALIVPDELDEERSTWRRRMRAESLANRKRAADADDTAPEWSTEDAQRGEASRRADARSEQDDVSNGARRAAEWLTRKYEQLKR
jgi:hypothetical protein